MTEPSLAFAARVTPLELTDPLAETLGARAPGETFRYTYEDAVKLAGHSCPTVAGAWLVTAAALQALYPAGQVPARGSLEVVVGGAPNDGSSGPMAQVIGLIPGAAPDTGFGGLMGKHRRQGLLSFDPATRGRVRFRRIDTGASVTLRYDPRAVPPPAELPALLAASLAGTATDEQRRRAGELWQARVADILTGDRARVIEVLAENS